jgi:teichuronic acid exporter
MKHLIIVSARGFGHALIRKKVATNTDFSTIFFFNIFVGIILFVFLFSLDPSLARIYNEPALHAIKRVMAFTLIINSLGLIQQTNLPKSVNFKLQTKITFISSILFGIIAILLLIKDLEYGALSGRFDRLFFAGFYALYL